jgi:hypothetical protein
MQSEDKKQAYSIVDWLACINKKFDFKNFVLGGKEDSGLQILILSTGSLEYVVYGATYFRIRFFGVFN